jgi:hypothetical protein
MSQIYHLLDESERFSEFSGGAISRWVANVLKDRRETVVCPSFDTSWGYPISRLFRLPSWDRCSQVHPLLYRSPWMIQKPIYLHVFRPLLERLTRGDILYIHNRPECADVLAGVAEERGIRLVLHMHNSLLHPRSRKHFPALKDVPHIQTTFNKRMLSITGLIAVSSVQRAEHRSPCQRSSSPDAWSSIKAYTC